MQAVVYNLLFITAHTFMGSYPSLDLCNQAIRSIYEKQAIPFPELVSKDVMPSLQQGVDLTVKYQRQYVCVKA